MFALLLACTPSERPDSPTLNDEGYFPEIDRPAAIAQWQPEDIPPAISAALVDGFPNAAPLHEIYLGMLAMGDEVCPGHDDHIDGLWLYGCTAESGYWFSGVSDTLSISNMNEEVWGFSGDLKFRDPELNTFAGGGHVLHAQRHSTEPGVHEFLQGTWFWEGDQQRSWFANGISGLLEVDLLRTSVDTLQLNGAIGFNDINLHFETMELSSDCNWGATGVLSIRDPGGAWHRLDFADSCSSCAQASFNDAPTGEVCLDFEPFVEPFVAYLDEG